MQKIDWILNQLSYIDADNNDKQVEIYKLNIEIEKFKKKIEEKIVNIEANIKGNEDKIDKKIVDIDFLDIFRNNWLDINKFVWAKFTFNSLDWFDKISWDESNYEQILKFIFIINKQASNLEENIYYSIDWNNKFANSEKKWLFKKKHFNNIDKTLKSITFDLWELKLENWKFKWALKIYINDEKRWILVFRINNNILTEIHKIWSSWNLAFWKDYNLVYW